MQNSPIPTQGQSESPTPATETTKGLATETTEGPASETTEGPVDRGTFGWITASNPRDFKTKTGMVAVRQKVMGSYLETAKSSGKITKQANNRSPNSSSSQHRKSSLLATSIRSPTSTIDPRGRARIINLHKALAKPPATAIELHEDHPFLYNPPHHHPSPPLDYSPDSTASIFWDGSTSSERLTSASIRHGSIDTGSSVSCEPEIFGPSSFPAVLYQGYPRPPSAVPLSSGQINPIKTPKGRTNRDVELAEPSAHAFKHLGSSLLSNREWKSVQSMLPEAWKWDVEYHILHSKFFGGTGSWTCTPLESDGWRSYPLTIASAPVVLPVEYQWPPCSGVTPPPDPHPAGSIDCSTELSLEVVRDLFLTFAGSIGFYILINGLLQVIVPDDFDTLWASSHLPHKYGGLKVCYIEKTLEPTMLPSSTETSNVRPSSRSMGIFHSAFDLLPPARLPAQSSARTPSLKLNDSIEARPLSAQLREKYVGRIGLKLSREDSLFIVMSTHIITEAILARSRWEAMFFLPRDSGFAKLENNWNSYTQIWAGDRNIGRIEKTFDKDVGVYPDGFHHDITLIRPTSPTVVEDIASPVPNLGWLNHDSWASLRQQTSTVKILADTESSRSAKSIKCSCPSDVLVVGEGIFLNQKAAAGGSKNLREHNVSTWKGLVSRALLYRVYPDFDPPNGHSGTALYADGVREDGTRGLGIVGFQSFVQRSGHVQNFDMEGPALERRLQLGRVAFYGAFEVPSELKKYNIV